MIAGHRLRRVALIVGAAVVLGGCDDRLVFYLSVKPLTGTTKLDVDSFVGDSMRPVNHFDVTWQSDGGVIQKLGFEVSRSTKNLTIKLTAYDDRSCTAVANWSGLDSGQLANLEVDFTGSFVCPPDGGVDSSSDGGSEDGSDGGIDAGSDAGIDVLPDGSADKDATVSPDTSEEADAPSDGQSTCPPPADPDAGLDPSVDGGVDLCTTYCQQIFAVCLPQAHEFYASVPDCLIKCVKVAWPVGSKSDLGGNTIGCRLHYLSTAQCNDVTPLGGACVAVCDNYRQLLAQTCGITDADCNPTTIQPACIRTAFEAARDPAWCVQAASSPSCAGGCAP